MMRPTEADLTKLREIIGEGLKEIRNNAGSTEELGRWIDVVLDTKTSEEALVAYNARAEWPLVLAENKARNEAKHAQELEAEARRREILTRYKGKGRPPEDKFAEVDYWLLCRAQDRFHTAHPRRRVMTVLRELVTEVWEKTPRPIRPRLLGASIGAVVHRLYERLQGEHVMVGGRKIKLPSLYGSKDVWGQPYFSIARHIKPEKSDS